MITQHLWARTSVLLLSVFLSAASARAADANPFLGDWALTIPGGNAGWLSVEQKDGKLSAQILWGWGSVVPVDGVQVDGNTLRLTRIHRGTRKDASGKTIQTRTVETITATLDGDQMKLATVKKPESGEEREKAEFTGKRLPPPPAAPDLAAVKFGDPISLFNGQDLTGWRLLEPNSVSGWSVANGILTNNPIQTSGTPHKNYGNLRTDREFEDFNLKVEFSVPKGGNSGIYLRGIYEIQVADSYGHGVDSHNMGAVYSRITPSEAAEKPAGEWQTIDITLVDRHVTVILNGKKIIDNKPVRGCTGGAIFSDPFKPGPIYVQGDHTGVNYRSLVLRPVVK